MGARDDQLSKMFAEAAADIEKRAMDEIQAAKDRADHYIRELIESFTKNYEIDVPATVRELIDTGSIVKQFDVGASPHGAPTLSIELRDGTNRRIDFPEWPHSQKGWRATLILTPLKPTDEKATDEKAKRAR